MSSGDISLSLYITYNDDIDASLRSAAGVDSLVIVEGYIEQWQADASRTASLQVTIKIKATCFGTSNNAYANTAPTISSTTHKYKLGSAAGTQAIGDLQMHTTAMYC